MLSVPDLDVDMETVKVAHAEVDMLFVLLMDGLKLLEAQTEAQLETDVDDDKDGDREPDTDPVDVRDDDCDAEIVWLTVVVLEDVSDADWVVVRDGDAH